MINAKKVLLIILSFCLLIAPLMFIWMVEISSDFKENVLVNGFQTFSSLKIYHISFYFLFFINLISAFLIVTSINRVETKTPPLISYIIRRRK